MPSSYANVFEDLHPSQIPFAKDLKNLWLPLLCDALKEQGVDASVVHRPIQYCDVTSASRKTASVGAVFIDNEMVPLGREEGWRGWVLNSFNGAIPRQARWCGEGIDASDLAVDALRAYCAMGDLVLKDKKLEEVSHWVEIFCQSALLRTRTAQAQSLPTRRTL
jgi:hypothetical protein